MNQKKDFKINSISFLLLVFLVLFPKGGFKIANIPITWGYLLLVFISGIAFLGLLKEGLKKISKKRFYTFLLIVPFQAMSIICLIFNGWTQIGFTLSFVISLILIPFFFIIVLGSYMDRIELKFIFNLLRHIIFIISIYGIILFFYRSISGSFLEIPFLTVNIDDLGLLDEKHIDRGGVFKLISTYNNGNIYGNCVLMFLPLYSLLETSRTKMLLVKVSLFLTLARTIWIGLFLYEVMSSFLFNLKYARSNNSKNFSLENLKTFFKTFVVLIIFVAGVSFSLSLFNADISFIFDPKLGGREDQLMSLINMSFLPYKSFDTIAEIVYLSILNQFGILGLFLFILEMTSPLIINSRKFSSVFSGNYYKQACAFGMILYLVISGADGAILYIPVMAIYWFLASLYLYDFNNLSLINSPSLDMKS
ncbi:MAG: hypothetical protein MH252_00220 [Thermosynechococcaceae cyanobacterium MS004]|nr:hypothetical protein [Thermosynechococcaceae cyanobacterium MS004]